MQSKFSFENEQGHKVEVRGAHLSPTDDGVEWVELYLRGFGSLDPPWTITKEEARRLFEVLRNLYPEFK